MKQNKIIGACNAMDKILKADIPFSIKSKIYAVRKTFQPEWDFQMEQEKMLIDALPRITDENGDEYVPKQAMGSFNKKMDELGDIDVTKEFEPISIVVTEEMDKAFGVLDGKDMYALEGIISFD